MLALTEFILLHYKEELKDAVSIERYICEHFRTFEFDIATRQRLANVISFATTWTESIVTKLINRIAAARKDHALSSQISHPRENQSIMKWLDNVNRLQQGEELPARNYDQYGTLTAEGASLLRDIVIDCKVSHTKTSLLFMYMETWFLRTNHQKTPTRRSLVSHFLRLQYKDRSRFMEKYNRHFSVLTQHNCVQKSYSLSDDSTHGNGKDKDKRKTLVLTGYDARTGPHFYTLSGCVNDGTTAEQAARQNVELIMQELGVPTSTPAVAVDHTDVRVATLLQSHGGSTTDNASDAVLESKLTFEKIKSMLPLAQRGVYNLDGLGLGVHFQLPVHCGDFYHIDNLTVNWGSRAAFQPKEKGNHRQKHHLQLLQASYDLWHNENVVLQNEFDKRVVPGKRWLLWFVRERDQRWNVNQLSAKRFVKLLRLMDKEDDTTPAFVVACRLLAHKLKSGTWNVVAKEIALMARNKGIIVALHFEAKNGEYMTMSNDYHKRPLPGGDTTAGFRALDIHEHFEKCVQWWNEASINTAKHYAAATKVIITMIPAKQQQYAARLKSGALAGLQELTKMSKKLYTAPLIFLLLRYSGKGPKLLRGFCEAAKIWLRAKNPVQIEDEPINQDLVRLNVLSEAGWGKFNSQDSLENQYKQLFEGDGIEKALHYFAQFGFLRLCVRKELKSLSHVKTRSYVGSSVSSVGFENVFPVLNETLDATFRKMPTSSLICEGNHGSLRANLNTSRGSDFQEVEIQHRVNNLHLSRSTVRTKEMIKKQNQFDAVGSGGVGRKRKQTASNSKPPQKFVQIKLYETLDQNRDHQKLSLERSFSYSKSNMNGVPTLSTFKSKGSNSRKERVDTVKIANFEKQSTKNTRKKLTNAEWDALPCELPQEKKWLPLLEQTHKDALQSIFVLKVWQCIPPAALFNLINVTKVLPCLVLADTVTTKFAALTLIKAHLKQINEIVHSTNNTNTLSNQIIGEDDSISTKLGYFIHDVTKIRHWIELREDGKNDKTVRSVTKAMFTAVGGMKKDQEQILVVIDDDDESEKNEESEENTGDANEIATPEVKKQRRSVRVPKPTAVLDL
jgi:hypothetical protein